MKTHNDFLMTYTINGVTIEDYVAYVEIGELNFHRVSADANNNRETPLTLEEFHLIADDDDIQEMITDAELCQIFVNQVKPN